MSGPASPPRPSSPDFLEPFYAVTRKPTELLDDDFFGYAMQYARMNNRRCIACRKLIHITVTDPNMKTVCSYVCYRLAMLNLRK